MIIRIRRNYLLWSIIKYFRGSLGLEGWSWEGSDGKRRLVLEKILSSGVFQVGFTERRREKVGIGNKLDKCITSFLEVILCST